MTEQPNDDITEEPVQDDLTFEDEPDQADQEA